MVDIIDLGTNSISANNQWVAFNAVDLDPKSTYLIQFSTVSSNLDLVYSRFIVRFSGTIKDIGEFYKQLPISLYPSLETQVFELFINELYDKDFDITIEVRRVPYWQNLSNLADCTVNLQVDIDGDF